MPLQKAAIPTRNKSVKELTTATKVVTSTVTRCGFVQVFLRRLAAGLGWQTPSFWVMPVRYGIGLR
jgi:hypothetical protein